VLKPPSKPHPLAVGKLLDDPRIIALPLRTDVKKTLARDEANRQRQGDFPSDNTIDGSVQRIIDITETFLAPGYPRALNATGVLLHTGLGRAPLADSAVFAMQQAAEYCLLEVDKDTGERGNRWLEIERKLALLTGAEAALVVNNCASAVLLALAGIASRKEVIVSRGELVEIGGGFRMPDVMANAGVKRVEVGTTNRTRLKDYQSAITEKTAALLKVHPSNYRVVGFTESASLHDLVELAHTNGLPLFEDLGNGLLFDLTPYKLPHEPTLLESIAEGVDLVAVSGDKCFGGPQAGILLGKKEWIAKCRKHALLRAVRPDKLTLAALDATVILWLSKRELEIPFFTMLSQTSTQLKNRAENIIKTIGETFQQKYSIKIVEDEAMIGSGAVPQMPFPDISLSMQTNSESIAHLAKRLRLLPIPLFSVVKENSIRIHLRSVLPKDDFLLAELIAKL